MARGEVPNARVFLESDGPRLWVMAEARLSGGGPRIVENLFEVRGESLVVGDRRELLTGWVDVVAVLGDG